MTLNTAESILGIAPSLSIDKFPDCKPEPEMPGTYHHTTEKHSQDQEAISVPNTKTHTEHDMQLYNVWLAGAQMVKEAIVVYATSIQSIPRMLNNKEIEQVLVTAGNTLKKSMDEIIDTRTASATFIIESLQLDHQKAALEYWSRLADQLQKYFESSRERCTLAATRLRKVTLKLWVVQHDLVKGVDEVYDRMVSNLD